MKSKSMNVSPSLKSWEPYKRISYPPGSPHWSPTTSSKTTPKTGSPSPHGPDVIPVWESSTLERNKKTSWTMTNGKLWSLPTNSQGDSTTWSIIPISPLRRKSKKPVEDYSANRQKTTICIITITWSSCKRVRRSKPSKPVNFKRWETCPKKKPPLPMMPISPPSQKESCSTCSTPIEMNLSMSKTGWSLSDMPTSIWSIPQIQFKDWPTSLWWTSMSKTDIYPPHWMSTHWKPKRLSIILKSSISWPPIWNINWISKNSSVSSKFKLQWKTLNNQD